MTGFNEDTLRSEIASVWGEHGAHMDVYLALLKRARARSEKPCPDCGELLAVVAYPFGRGDWDWECRNKDGCLSFHDSGFPLVGEAPDA